MLVDLIWSGIQQKALHLKIRWQRHALAQESRLMAVRTPTGRSGLWGASL
jgi:hypothetical protein